MRNAALSDADEIAELENLLFDNAMGARMLRQELRLGSGFVEGEDKILGYVLLRKEEDITDITRLGVHPESQGKGVGTALLLKALENAKVVILTVQKTNLAALKLYFKYGFEIVAHLHSASAWVMMWRCKS